MSAAGFTIMGHDDCPIVPVYFGDAQLAADVSEELMNENIYVISFSFPVVPQGKARIRCQLSASHTEEDIQRTIDAFTKVGKAKNII
jgi:glycine C-acetyltransferase